LIKFKQTALIANLHHAHLSVCVAAIPKQFWGHPNLRLANLSWPKSQTVCFHMRNIIIV